jgi:hypothetical protein
MRKLLLWIAIAGWSSVFGCGGAMAQNIVGQWLNVGQTAQGDYALTLFFGGNGALQYQMAVRAAPGTGLSGGVALCEGDYQFDGQTLMTQLSCQNGMPVQLGGPVQFLDPNTFNIGGDIFRRQ